MLRIRLSRTGAKKQASFRIVVADIDAKRDGRIVERIGFYNPRNRTSDFTLDEGRALYWLSVGAQPTDAVRRFLDRQGTYGRLERMRQGEALESLAGEVVAMAPAGRAESEPEAPARTEMEAESAEMEAEAAEAEAVQEQLELVDAEAALAEMGAEEAAAEVVVEPESMLAAEPEAVEDPPEMVEAEAFPLAEDAAAVASLEEEE
ncbi:MAG: 30S ribosomal protein S16 [Candidatus Promineifilaceae bacterium]